MGPSVLNVGGIWPIGGRATAGGDPLGSLRIDNTVLELRAEVAPAQADSICRRFRLG